MGFLKDKYTREYFTNQMADGKRTDYGALGADEWREGGIFHEIQEQIDLVDLTGAHVLEIGYGRGESARYMFREKGIARYTGVDFSEVAHELACESLAGISKERWRLEIADALEYMRSKAFRFCFDAVFMLDAIEHIPRSEVLEILPLILQALKPGGFLVVDTPFYGIDEDYIDQRFRFLQPSATDLHPATEGMHCNKYTRERIRREIGSAGFKILSDKKYQKPQFPDLQKRINWLCRSGRDLIIRSTNTNTRRVFARVLLNILLLGSKLDKH